MNLTQVKSLAVIPALTAPGSAVAAPNARAAIPLLVGTGLVESGYEYLAQYPTGPAAGFWQMEWGSATTTYEDTWTNFLAFNQSIASAVLQLAGANSQPPGSLMQTNLLFACAMLRIKYWRSPLALPSATDAVGLANYWKDVYTTSGGAGSVAIATPYFQSAIDA